MINPESDVLRGNMTNIEYAAYGAFFVTDVDGKTSLERAITASNIEDVENRLDLKEETIDSVAHDVKTGLNDDHHINGAVAKGVWHFYANLKSFYELSFLCDYAPSLFSSSYFKSSISDYASKNFEIVKTISDINIYGISGANMSIISRILDRLHEIDRGFAKIGSALLLSLVAAYDSAFSEFCKTLLKSKPERYLGSDKKISVSEVLSLESIDQVIDKIIDDKLDQTMRKSHGDHIDFFENMFHVDIKKTYPRWAEYLEIFERRNLSAHGNLIVNDIYLRNLKSHDIEESIHLGMPLNVDGKYFENSVDVLIEFGIISALSAWKKQFPNQREDASGALIEISFNLLCENHPKVARNVLEFANKSSLDGSTEEQKKMMIINLAIAQKGSGDQLASDKLLNSTDWSLCGPNFHLCRHSIQENEEDALKFLEPAMDSKLISIDCVREWPAFRWIRSSDKFREEVERLFLEPLFPSKDVSSDLADADREE